MNSEINFVNVYSFITPIVIVLIAMEVLYCKLTKKDYINFQDAMANLGTAIGNQSMNLFVVFFVVTTYGWLYQFRIATIPNTFWNFVILLVLFDFLFYWYHRWNHTINVLWAVHMSHHTSEEFNLFVALRASITQRIFSFFFMWPLALLGFTPEAIYAASAVQLLIAFWHHTKVIGKMPGFEIVFNSPSHHRVHHGMNEKYLDKNFGEIFIVWDKLFGTFQKEEEKVVFGALTPPQTWDPNRIYAQFWYALWVDCKNTKSWWDKIRLWFMPLGWRPEDLRNNPRKRVNEFTLVKFQSEMYSWAKPYLIAWAMLGLGIMAWTINMKNDLSNWDRFILSVLVIWPMITAWGGILEKKEWVKWFEPLRIAIAVGTIGFIVL